MDANVVTFKFPALLARLTRTRADKWAECHGLPTGCGLDFYYAHGPSGMEAYVNVDQMHVSVSIMDKDGDEVGGHEGETHDEFLRQYVTGD
jgi:hypothetical protein